MRTRFTRLVKIAAATLAAGLTLSACANVVDGTPSITNAANSRLDVKGVDSSSSFDQLAQNALTDIEGYWKTEYPKISGGKQLTALKGGYYSVDGAKVAETDSAAGQPVSSNACAQKTIRFLVNNAAFCQLDDSIVWDRAQKHLFTELANKYGNFVVAMIFAHEFGHSIQARLGVFDSNPATVLTESQADCASGAWAASAIAKQAPHFRTVTLKNVDDALEGFLDARDSTPDSAEDVSHGNGFDRLSAVADGFDKGATYCYSKGYFQSRTITSRPYSTADDAANGGNLPLSQIVNTSSTNLLTTDLNRFWTAKAKTVGKTFRPVKIAQAAHPKCGASSSSEFGYCPDDNTVYFSASVAQKAYYSLPDVKAAGGDAGDVQLLSNLPADFALGTLFSIGWGFAVRHQLFNRDMSGGDALESGVCYTGAYAKDVNVAGNAPGNFVLSPADLDESVSALLNRVPQETAFGARGTTGLGRVQAFIKGYKGGLSTC